MRVKIPVGAGDFLYLKTGKTGSGFTQPLFQWVPVFFPGAKAAGASPCSADVNTEWNCTSPPPLPPLCLHDNFTFILDV